MKALIVEDNIEVRQMIRLFIADIFDEIKDIEKGEDAFKTYSKFQPDWVLMDFQMQELNGIEATKQIIAKYPDAKIIMVTSHNDKLLREQATKAGVKGFILKENLEVLRDIIH